MKIKQVANLVAQSFNHWKGHRATRMGAALSYYAIFSILPFLSIILMIIGPLLDHAYLQRAIADQARVFIGGNGASFVQSILSGVTDLKFTSFSIVVTIGVFIIAVLGVFYELKNTMDDLFDSDITVKARRGLKYFFSSRLLSLSMIPILGFLFIISLVFGTLLNLVQDAAPALIHLLQIASIVFSLFVTTFLFAFIFRYIPHKKLPWKDLVRGAFVTAVLFMLGKSVINFYVAHLTSISAFGAAGAFVILLVWIYYSAQIFLFGASLTYVYSATYGRMREK